MRRNLGGKNKMAAPVHFDSFQSVSDFESVVLVLYSLKGGHFSLVAASVNILLIGERFLFIG